MDQLLITDDWQDLPFAINCKPDSSWHMTLKFYAGKL